MMEYTITTEGEVVIINLSGNFVRSVGEELNASISGLLDDGSRYLLVDISNVPLIDSYGITVCIACYKMVENSGGLLFFVNPGKAVEKVFHITHADQKFRIVKNKDQGMKSIQEKIRASSRPSGGRSDEIQY
ncbi:MAG: STAS domain-containing protein [Syntrophales bacterium]